MIPTDYFWKNIFLLALGTILIRGSIIAISSKVRVSQRVREIFSFIPAAVLPAFIAPSVSYHTGKVEWLYDKERLFVLIIAVGVSYITKSIVATITLGLVLLYFISHY